MRHRRLAMLGAALAMTAGAVAMAVVPSAESRAEDAGVSATFLVPVNDGYGIGECVGSGSACAEVVATQWCLAQGYSRSVSFGLADAIETTGSIVRAADTRPIAITCGR